MNWLSFFIGVLVGWIVEWIIDFFYWRRRYQSCQSEKEDLQARLTEAERRLKTFQVKGWEPETEVRRVPTARVALQEVAITPPDVDLDVHAPELDADSGLDAFFDALRARFPDVDLGGSIDRLKARFPDLNIKTALRGLKLDFPDLDLDGAFEGLKARFPRLDWDAEADLDVDLEAPEVTLPAADLDVDLDAPEVTLPAVDLAVGMAAPEVEVPDTSLDAFFDDLRARLPDVDLDASIGRLRARIPDIDIEGAFQGLKADLPDVDLDGAVEGLKARFPQLADRQVTLPTLAPGQPDDLKVIEGIGPKISRLLKSNGILTFAQLADASIDQLEAILQAGGPNFQLADPATWPEQARLAADGAWDELTALQGRLIGGRQSRQWRR